MTPTALPSTWRERAAELEPYVPAVAHAFRVAAEELEQAWQGHANEALGLDEAAKESGYSREHLSDMVRDGKLTNVGRQRRPLVRRAELPRKPGGATLKSEGHVGVIGEAARASRIG